MDSQGQQNDASQQQQQRRRSSGFMPAFEGLQRQRDNDTSAARRQSLSDQQAKGGIFSQIFHNNFGKNSK